MHKTNPAPVINIRIESCFKMLETNHTENPIVPSESLNRAITFVFLIFNIFIISVEKLDVATKSIAINVIIFIQVSIYVGENARLRRVWCAMLESNQRPTGCKPVALTN